MEQLCNSSGVVMAKSSLLVLNGLINIKALRCSDGQTMPSVCVKHNGRCSLVPAFSSANQINSLCRPVQGVFSVSLSLFFIHKCFMNIGTVNQGLVKSLTIRAGNNMMPCHVKSQWKADKDMQTNRQTDKDIICG